MRRYRRNSPQAAARIVALAAIVDGRLSTSELDMLERLDGYRLLGLSPLQMKDVIGDLTDDLLGFAFTSLDARCRIDATTLSVLLAEIDDPLLRETVLHLCLAVAYADRQWSDGELWIIAAASARWQLTVLPQ